jgi:hypothetical protein
LFAQLLKYPRAKSARAVAPETASAPMAAAQTANLLIQLMQFLLWI